MTITETVLVFVGAPLAIAGVLALLVFGAGGRRAPRYRPGRPFNFAPVWFLASPPRDDADHADGERAALPAAPGRAALTAGDRDRRTVQHVAAAGAGPATKKGGARGTW
jgi:hypothetical protein